MTELETLQNDEWYKSRPEIIRNAIDKYPPIHHYKMKSTGKQCFIIAYDEPESGKLEDVTVTVQKTGKGGLLDQIGLSELDTNQVIDVPLHDLEIWTE